MLKILGFKYIFHEKIGYTSSLMSTYGVQINLKCVSCVIQHFSYPIIPEDYFVTPPRIQTYNKYRICNHLGKTRDEKKNPQNILGIDHIKSPEIKGWGPK